MGSNHFYTVYPSDVNTLIKRNFHLEGIACYVHTATHEGTTPLYRLSSGTTDQPTYFYTTSLDEVTSAIKQRDYRLDGLACGVFSTRQPETRPLFRAFNPNSADYFYTTDEAEVDNAIANAGYRDKGIAGYVYDPAHTLGGTSPFYRLFNG